jgi:hypothetical protein
LGGLERISRLRRDGHKVPKELFWTQSILGFRPFVSKKLCRRQSKIRFNPPKSASSVLPLMSLLPYDAQHRQYAFYQGLDEGGFKGLFGAEAHGASFLPDGLVFPII